MIIVLALGSLLFAALNDLVFKFYARKQRSRGIYVAVIGMVWAFVFIIIAKKIGCSENFSITLIWGLISGLFSVIANIMLIESMTNSEVGICATIYRLNLVPAALFAFILLKENISLWKIIGILCALVSVLAFTPASEHKCNIIKNKYSGFSLVIVASLLRAGMGLSYKYGLSQGADKYYLLAINGGIWIIGGLTYLIIKERKSMYMLKKPFTYGIISGILICGIVFFMATALQYGDASIVLPITQLSFIATSTMGVFVLKESFNMKKIIGLCSGILCVLFMTIKN